MCGGKRWLQYVPLNKVNDFGQLSSAYIYWFYSNATLKAFFTRSHIHPFTHIIIKFLLCTLNYFFPILLSHAHLNSSWWGLVSWSRTPWHAHESAAHQTCSSFWLVDNPLNFFSHIFLPGCPCLHLSFYYQMRFVRPVCYFRYLFFPHLDL